MANLVTFALIGNISGDDFAKKVRTASVVATFSHSLVRVFVKVPLKLQVMLHAYFFTSYYCSENLLEVELEKIIISQHSLEKPVHRGRSQISESVFLFSLIELRPCGIDS